MTANQITALYFVSRQAAAAIPAIAHCHQRPSRTPSSSIQSSRATGMSWMVFWSATTPLML